MNAATHVQPQVPAELAATLRDLQARGDHLLFDAALVHCRSLGWRAPSLAAATGLNAATISKRIERARPGMLLAQRIEALQIPHPPKRASKKLLLQLRNAVLPAAISDDVELLAACVQHCVRIGWPVTEVLRASTPSNRVSAHDWEATVQALLQRSVRSIPDLNAVRALRLPAPNPGEPTTMHGRRLSEQRIAELRAKRVIASRVNGAMPEGHPARAVSREFSDELQRLVDEHYPPYYLAQVIGVSHRAITSRLERHGYRDPCPSVADTPSGVYRGRRTGSPERIRHLLPPERAQYLQCLYQQMLDLGPATYRGSPPDSAIRVTSDRLDAELLQLRAQGLTLKYLAEVLGVSPGSLKYRMDRYQQHRAKPGSEAAGAGL